MALPELSRQVLFQPELNIVEDTLDVDPEIALLPKPDETVAQKFEYKPTDAIDFEVVKKFKLRQK